MKVRGRGSEFRHGEPEHHVVSVDGLALTVLLRRGARRTLSLRVDERGTRVDAPRGAAIDSIEGFVREHADWIQRHVARIAQARTEAAIEIADGTRLDLFGESRVVRLVAGRRTAGWGDDEMAILLLPAASPLPALERAVRNHARQWFERRVRFHCERLGEPSPPVALSSARRRWGSCSRRSGIRLHWKLALLPVALADYVVAHEVAHLREMNHSSRFWALVAGLYPDWRAARAALRARAGCLPEFVTAADTGGMPGVESR